MPAPLLALLLTGVPNPGSGTAPPGSEGFLTILGWAAWIGLVLGVLGVIIVGAMMVIGHLNGRGGGQYAAMLGWVFAGCILITGASSFVQAFVV